ncbi:DMT family transporter [Microcoleus sp. FACHB-672]|uniref:DMT family transporter n=1 Tax=Microcoleus sp. FACHB-672 TaxID=2692825 RepID=UPI0016884971|nr:DMT family transporter [Microcoleus sp. FACHB-672]MBD2043126.1 DMT family transporter [Microcoleus sp. FACHB-672]
MYLRLSESKRPLATLLLIAPFFLWGTAMVAMKGVIPNTTPLFMAGVRLLPAGVLVLIAAAMMGRPALKGWGAWLWVAFFALVDGAMFQGFLAEGLLRTGAGLGSVMIDSQPLAVAILSWWLFGERIGLWGWLGLGVGVLGIALIGLPDAWILGLFQQGIASVPVEIGNLFENGEWLMLLAALSMAVGTVTIRYVCRYADAVVATGWHMILGGIALLTLSLATESQQWVNIDLSGWAALAYATIFGSALAYGLFFYFASTGSLTSLSALTFLTPVFALLFGNLFLAEVLSPLQSIGVCLTIVSIYLINQRDTIAQKLRLGRTVDQTIASAEETAAENRLLLQSSESKSVELPVTVRIAESEPEI